MIELEYLDPGQSTGQGTSIPVVDAGPLIDYYTQIGMPIDDFDNINSSRCEIFPSSGRAKFLVRTADLYDPANNTLNDTILKDKVWVPKYGTADGGILRSGVWLIKSVSHIDNSVIGWTPHITIDPNDPNSLKAPAPLVTILEFVEPQYYLDDIITKDYNLSTEERVNHLSWEDILNDILDGVTILGTQVTHQLYGSSGYPPVKPINVMSAGVSILEFFTEFADRHFLTATMGAFTSGNVEDSEGTVNHAEIIIVTDKTPNQVNFYSHLSGTLIRSNYGTSTLEDNLSITFSPRERCGEGDWGVETEPLIPVDSPDTDNNPRFQNIADKGFLYPFYDLDGNSTTSETITLTQWIANRYAERTQLQGSFLIKLKTAFGSGIGPCLTAFENRLTTVGVIKLYECTPPNLSELRYIDSFMYRRKSQNGKTIEFVINSVSTESGGVYDGLKKASVTITFADCCNQDLIGQTVDVIDHSGCLLDEDPTELVGRYGWAHWGIANNQAEGDEFTPCHWSMINICCPPDAGSNYLTWTE